MNRIRTAAALAICGALIVAACEPATAPKTADQIRLSLVGGGGQSGVVGAELPQPLVIKAATAKGVPLRDVVVNFRVTSGGGSMFAGVASTDSKGIAEDYWTLGTSTADAQTVEVRAVLSDGTKQVFGVFTATALAGTPARISASAGDAQSAAPGAVLPTAPAVALADAYGNATPGITVTFAVVSGGGSVTGANAVSNAGGIATLGSWTLGAPGPNSLTATASGAGIAGNPVTFTANAVAALSWSTRATMPTTRYDFGSGALNGIVYAVGGFSNGQFLTTVEAYDPATNQWTTRAPLPEPRVGPGVGVVGGKLYVIGGINSSGLVAPVAEYDPAADHWIEKATMPNARFEFGVAVVNNVIYAAGGINAFSTIVGTLEAYDPATDSWSERAPMPTARFRLAAGELGGALYAVGGLIGNPATAAVEAYDPASDSWTARAPEPSALYYQAAAGFSGALYALGGANTSSTAGLATVFRYDPAANSWSSAPALPTARLGLGAVVTGGVLYAFGGFGGNGTLEYLGTVEAFGP